MEHRESSPLCALNVLETSKIATGKANAQPRREIEIWGGIQRASNAPAFSASMTISLLDTGVIMPAVAPYTRPGAERDAAKYVPQIAETPRYCTRKA